MWIVSRNGGALPVAESALVLLLGLSDAQHWLEASIEDLNGICSTLEHWTCMHGSREESDRNPRLRGEGQAGGHLADLGVDFGIGLRGNVAVTALAVADEYKPGENHA
jgi:hypothetical protein